LCADRKKASQTKWIEYPFDKRVKLVSGKARKMKIQFKQCLCGQRTDRRMPVWHRSAVALGVVGRKF
jgi:hypothetical protein